MNHVEEMAHFTCEGDHLIGIVARPEMPATIGVVVIVGGPQYRAGSHRQFVLLSRALATSGIAVLRFDYRGMGDSDGDLRDFEAITSDVGVAIDALQMAVPSVKRIALWGLCDGASAALLYCHEARDPRVTGLCLLNPWVRSKASLARTQVKHYYVKRLLQAGFWKKLLSGQVATSALNGLFTSVSALVRDKESSGQSGLGAYPQKMAATWTNFDGRMLLLLSGNDYTAKEFLEHVNMDTKWAQTLLHAGLTRHDLASADHTFSNLSHRSQVEQLTSDWLGGERLPIANPAPSDALD